MNSQTPSTRNRLKGSITVIALITCFILLLIGLGITELLHFSMTISDRDYEWNRGRWFLEGRTQEFMDGVLSGKTPLKAGKSARQEKIDGASQGYSFEIGQKNDTTFLHAVMRWKNRYPIEQYIELRRLNLFDYAVFFQDKLTLTLQRDMMISGAIAAPQGLSIHGGNGQSLRFHSGSEARVDFGTEPPDIDATTFSYPLDEILKNPNFAFNINAGNRFSTFVNKKSLSEMRLPPFEDIWNALLAYRDPAWTIEPSSFFNKKLILNTLSSEKRLLAFGDGYTTRFPNDGAVIKNVYIMKTRSNKRYQTISSRDFSYYQGFEDSRKYFSADKRYLTLHASSKVLDLPLSDDSYRLLNQIRLQGNNARYISRDETVQEIYFDENSRKIKLLQGVDYNYNPKEQTMEILSSAFKRNHVVRLGVGDGRRVEFPFPLLGRVVYLYQRGERAFSYSLTRDQVQFASPPPYGDPIEAFFNPPRVSYKKQPPAEGTGIFIDKIDEAVVLDLDQVYNYPRNHVIIATAPLYIKGRCRSPLLVISRKSIYINNLNPSMEGEPLFAVSGEGVWVYREQNQPENKINKCVIYSPLDGLYTLNESGEAQNFPLSYYGTAVFTMEKTNAVMAGPEIYEKNFFYFPGIKNYADKEPFSHFPLPVEISSVRRN